MSRRLLSIFVAAMFFLGCGTQDYPSPIADESSAPQPADERSLKANDPNGAFAAEPLPTGYLWRGLEVLGYQTEFLTGLRCAYQDAEGTRASDALADAMATGIIAGMVISASNMISSHSSTSDEHGASGHGQSGLMVRILAAGVKGGLFLSACETLLAGGNWTSFSGILGQDFVGLSSSLASAGATAIAGGPLLKRFFDGPRYPTGPFKGILFSVLPHVSIFLVSTGVGYVVYHHTNRDLAPDQHGAPVVCHPSH